LPLVGDAAAGYHAGTETWEDIVALRKFIIERDIPGAGTLEREQLRGAAAKSNGVLRDLGPDIQWVESYVAADKTFWRRTRRLSASTPRSAASRRPRSPKFAR
jgi:hypothetical protein